MFTQTHDMQTFAHTLNRRWDRVQSECRDDETLLRLRSRHRSCAEAKVDAEQTHMHCTDTLSMHEYISHRVYTHGNFLTSAYPGSVWPRVLSAGVMSALVWAVRCRRQSRHTRSSILAHFHAAFVRCFEQVSPLETSTHTRTHTSPADDDDARRRG